MFYNFPGGTQAAGANPTYNDPDYNIGELNYWFDVNLHDCEYDFTMPTDSYAMITPTYTTISEWDASGTQFRY